MERIFSRPVYLALLVAVGAFIVYLLTLAPSVDFIDAGELATDCYTLGICHPTGYPLFTLVGWVFSRLPIAGSVIFRLNIMAAFFTALGAGGVVLLANELFAFWMPDRVKRSRQQKNRGGVKRSGSQKQNGKPSVRSPHMAHPLPPLTPQEATVAPIAAFAAGIAAAFSATWWAQSTSIEVYPLHLFLVPLALLFFLRMLRTEETEGVGRNGKLFALFLGLSFTNHMTTILLAPACLYMFFARYRFSHLAWRRIVNLAPFFIAALLFYLYLPIRSSQYPPMDWGHPATWGNFLRHVTAKQFQIWMYTGSGAAAKQWAYFWSRVPKEFTIVGMLLSILGLWKMFNAESVRRTHILAFTLLLFLGCLLYSINYDIHDIDSYFLLAYLAIALWIGVGILVVAQSITRAVSNNERANTNNGQPATYSASRRTSAYVVAIIAIVLAIIEIGANYSENDESGNYMVEDYTLNMLRNLPPHAIIFSTQWDFWVSGAFYYQLVQHVRPDVLVIDKAMLRDRPWYYHELEQRAPDVFAKVKPEEDAFLRYLNAFVSGESFNEAAIAPAYQAFTNALVDRNIDRPIFITQEMVDQRDDLFAPDMKIIPAGIAYRLWPRDTVFETQPPKLVWNDVHYRQRDYYTDELRTLEAMPLARYGAMELQQRNMGAATQFFDAALTFTPDLNANLDRLSERDQGVAESTNQTFGQIEKVRSTLGK